MRETNEAAREAGEGQPPEEELRRYIGVFLHRVLAPGSEAVHRLITREMNDPTPALDILVEQGVRPRVEYLSGVIARIIGCDPRTIRACSAAWPASRPRPSPTSRTRSRPAWASAFKPTPAEIDKAAHHIATFSIAGVRAVGLSLKTDLRAK